MTSTIFLNITMSVFVIGETTSTTLHSSKLMFESSVAETFLQAASQKRQTVFAKLELPHFIETAFVQASIVCFYLRFKKQSSAHTLIFAMYCSGTVL